MSKLESNIKKIQSFVNYCVQKVDSSYSYSFSVKQDILTAEQFLTATEKELEKVSDEFMVLLRLNPILQQLSDYIDASNFLWDSTFIEALSLDEKRKYSDFKVSLLDSNAYFQNPTQYDEQLPYFSAIINYAVLSRYISYLKGLMPVVSATTKAEEVIEEITIEPETNIDIEEPQDFESNFNERQIEILAQCVNELKLFKQLVSAELMHDIFLCKLKEPLRIGKNKNKLLAYLLSSLDNHSLITREWQSVCAKNGLFLSSGKGVVMQQGNFSSAVAQNNDFPPKDSHIIDNYIKQLKRD